MSEQIPESIPTSADPRSKRPLKKARPTPNSETASAISSLMSKPDALINIPTSSTSISLTKTNGSAPPEIVQNVQGSSAGAGSGEFHVYKASRRREYERLRGMAEEVRSEKEEETWAREKKERERRDEEKTRKNREKRNKKRKGGAGKEGCDEVGKEGKIKARVVVKEGMEGLGGEGPAQADTVPGERGNVVEEVGVIIHDDD